MHCHRNSGDGVRIGNFVETKAATIEAGAKVNHLSYVGDAHVGAGANLGADGFFKHKTTIGEGAFVGTNSPLVAPVKIGNGAISDRARSSPRTCPMTRWPWSAARRATARAGRSGIAR